ncbi:UPF0489 protein C5orf22 homolog isoform X2 [Asterias rubens]|uniref:UPF0489 protein C5orf22 homolog isoform X2 n=1 Tax=Asterias rubens TaxID=7604 RepID=UPI001454FDB7|nr:UPF0489 protein C5orf22 homolog isoform X2 [Asterias rubens]
MGSLLNCGHCIALVLPHIYRAISSRHLPYQGVTMLHFDSHPDMQIATELDADTVFDKYELFSALSIENWILPAVYAGHIRHLVWIKPPWADQLPEGSRQVVVGKHKESKKLRITWPDGYFMSDCLYAPKEDLECTKDLSVDVVTMDTDIVPRQSNTAPADFKTKTDNPPQSRNSPNQESCSSCGCMPDRSISQSTCASDRNTQSLESEGAVLAKSGCRSCKENKESDLLRLKNSSKTNDNPALSETEGTQTYKGHDKLTSDDVCVTASAAMERGNATILDIDLDFFSTRNPFKEIYPETQFRQLEDLYRFEGPVDDSESALRDCTDERATQLKELELALRLVINGEEKTKEVSDERFKQVKSFIDALRPSLTSEPLDAEMIHMAGLTCDDNGELPHHVSTEAEIDSLMVATETLLSSLPKPVIVTVARSSHDDYCPPEQVDQIQQKLLKILQNTYGKLDVHLDYSNQVDS